MTQIPPRGTPEFEEYKKHVEEAHRKGARIEIHGKWQTDWTPINHPAFNGWDKSLYRIAPDQPQSVQSPEPSMTPTEQRIVKALDQIVYALGEVYRFAECVIDGNDAWIARMLFHIDEASSLVTSLVVDLPHPSPSEAPSEATAAQPEAKTGGSEAVAAFKSHGLASKPVPLQTQVGGEHYQNFPIQPVEFITANKLNFLEGCIVKRICRHRNKNGVEDLRKAIHEIELLIELEYGKEQP
jgi:hypothetical protein